MNIPVVGAFLSAGLTAEILWHIFFEVTQNMQENNVGFQSTQPPLHFLSRRKNNFFTVEGQLKNFWSVYQISLTVTIIIVNICTYLLEYSLLKQ